MNQLPVELLPIIFKDVDFKDKVNLRSVNKVFNEVIDGYRIIKELAVFEVQPLRVKKYRWYYTDDLISDNDKHNLKIQYNDKNKFKLNLKSKCLINLKRLKVNFSGCIKSVLPFLNDLQKLEHFEISAYLDEDKLSIELNHTNLKILKVYFCKKNEFSVVRLQVNCPQLIAIGFNHDFSMINIIHPQNLRQLDVKSISLDKRETLNQLDNFINLECFYPNQIDLNTLIDKLEIVFAKLININKMIIRRDFDNFRSKDELKSLEQILIRLLDRKNKLKNNVDIYLNERKLNNEDDINEKIEEQWNILTELENLVEENLDELYEEYDHDEELDIDDLDDF